MARSERVEFEGAFGDTLAARLERPSGVPRAYALFAHCFSCSKDILAATRISQRLARQGIAVLRFDFTGLGHSEGEFANTNFSSNIEDLIQAAAFLERDYEAPTLLIGHSLGGAAVIAAARRIASTRAVVTINAPADADHVRKQFTEQVPEIEARGEAEVHLAGRPFRIKKQFLDDIEGRSLEEAAASLKLPILIAHSPVDETVSIENATRLFVAAKHPKSFLSLDHANHLLSGKHDAQFVADVVAAWASRYAAEDRLPDPPAAVPHGVVVQETRQGKFQNWVVDADDIGLTDEPESFGGLGSGPTPYGLLSASLGACTSMTIRMYADRKDWPLDRVTVTVTHNKDHADDCAHCGEEHRKVDIFERSIRLEGDLDSDQLDRLMEIADRCPVHRTLHEPVVVRTRRAP
ncbi:MAG: alpha/beta fold hydrolase [Alphaproteobacteria bacterium]|nr:alpha/beta fold hydrolase [Alphaproteobacteria bacterium]